MTCVLSASNHAQVTAPVSNTTSLQVLIVSHYFWPEEFRVNELARDLRNRGHRVTVATGRPNYPGHRIFPAFRRTAGKFAVYDGDIVVERFPTIGIGSGSLGLILNYLSLSIAITVLAPWRLRRRTFDTIICFQPSPFTIVLPALILSKVKRAPVVLWVLDCWPETLEAIGIVRNQTALRIIGEVVGYAYRRCAVVLGQSRSFGASIARWSGRNDLFAYFPNWVEDIYTAGSRTSRSTTVRPEISNDSLFTVVFAGNIGEAQDFPTIVRTIVALRNCPVRWLIVGGGRMEEWVRQEIARYGLSDRVEMPGRRPTAEMPALFALADALLVSLDAKPVFAMTVPGKVQSYMAAGKPIVGALDGEGATLIAAARCGLTAPAGDHEALANVIARLVSTPSEALAQMGENGRVFAAEHFDRRTILDKFDQWLHEAARRGPPYPMSGA